MGEFYTLSESCSIIKYTKIFTYPFSTTIGDNSSVISKYNSSPLGLEYISIVPENVLYKVPVQLVMLTSILLIISFLFGLMLVYYLTQRNYKQVSNIIAIFNSAKKGETLPSLPTRITNEFSYIIHNIVKTFIEQNYLKLQLSEKHYKMQAIQLMALQSQMNPHFLYNTLNAIYWEAFSLTQGQNRFTSMITNLSDVLKYSLSPDQTVPLKYEIKNTLAYIKVQQQRYIDKFNVIWSYDEALLEVYIIKLILQPLIENSIYHGFKETEAKNIIKIKIFQRDSYLKITVIDNGVGMNKQRLEQIKASMKVDYKCTNHIGVLNSNQRLKLKYGEEYSLIIQSKQGLGTVVTLKIPVNTG